MNGVGVALAVTPDSRRFPGGEQMAEDAVRVAIARRFPDVTGVEIEWVWEGEFQLADRTVIPGRWVVMATGDSVTGHDAQAGMCG